VPSAVFSRYFASQIWREIGAIRSETDPIIASTFISMALPYLSPCGIAPAILRSGSGSDGHRGSGCAACSYADLDARAIRVSRALQLGLLYYIAGGCPPQMPARNKLNPDTGYINLNETLLGPGGR
jgi:hypothetical protein